VRRAEDYVIRLPATREAVAAHAEAVFDRVWRFDFEWPGFCLLDFGADVDSHALRAFMVELKERLADVCLRRTGQRFICRSAGRFDQQETTRFHLDGAPDRSLLVLGYEPSPVRSRLFLADYTRCAFDLGITLRQFLTEHNPMFNRGEQELAPYVTEVRQAGDGHSQVLLINNSSLPFAPEHGNPLGVLHKAEILNPSATEQRLVNSVMLAALEPTCADAIGLAELQEFVRTERISQRVY
jgi:hypothetical protein